MMREALPSEISAMSLQDTRLQEVRMQFQKFEEAKKEISVRIGTGSHKCVTMRRVLPNCMVVDEPGDRVGFISPDTLAQIASEKYQEDAGYLKGSIGLDY
jgi:hypothetical protein